MYQAPEVYHLQKAIEALKRALTFPQPPSPKTKEEIEDTQSEEGESEPEK